MVANCRPSRHRKPTQTLTKPLKTKKQIPPTAGQKGGNSAKGGTKKIKTQRVNEKIRPN
jgi:hypothetical protein